MSKGKNNPSNVFQQGADALCSLTDQVLKTAQELQSKFVCTSSPVKIQDAIGCDGEVSVAVPSGGSGEVILSFAGAIRHYPAKAYEGGKSFARGTKVQVKDAVSDTLFIAEC